MTTLTDTILSTPALLALLALVIRGVLYSQRGLSWYEYRTLHGLKRLLAPRLDDRFGVSLVNPKGYRDDGEFLYTDIITVSAVAKYLHGRGGSYHLVNSLKRRTTPDGTVQYSRAHLVWFHGDGTQTEVYLFAAVDGGTDVYAHHETAVTDPDGHLTDGQTDGDPRGVVRNALEEADAG